MSRIDEMREKLEGQLAADEAATMEAAKTLTPEVEAFAARLQGLPPSHFFELLVRFGKQNPNMGDEESIHFLTLAFIQQQHTRITQLEQQVRALQQQKQSPTGETPA